MPAPDGPVLVTGANGFIGSHLVEALVRQGHRVRCLVRRTSDLTFIRHLPVDWAYGDLGSGDGLRAACRGVRAVCHCAALTRAGDEATFLRVNATATEELALACLHSTPDLSRFLFLSSVAALGPAQSLDCPVSESSPAKPITWYGRSKLAAEQILLTIANQLPVTIVRPAPVFGPRDRDFLAYFRLLNWGLELQLGREERWVSLIYVLDLVSLILLALGSEKAQGRTYNASGSTHTRHEFAQAIARALHRRSIRLALPPALLGPVSAASDLQAIRRGRPGLLNSQRILDMRERFWLCSGARAAEELGFRPRFDLGSAVRDTVEWYRGNRWL